MAKFYAKAPDGSDATLSITVSGFTQSLQQNGWCKMPNGLILQWRLDTLSGQYAILTFPISFTNMVYAIILQNSYPRDDGSSAGWSASNVLKYSLDQVRIHYADAKGFLLATGY